MSVDINSFVVDLFNAGFSPYKGVYAGNDSIEVNTGCKEHKVEISFIGDEILVRHKRFPGRDYILDKNNYLIDFAKHEAEIFNNCLDQEYKNSKTDSFQDACEQFKDEEL